MDSSPATTASSHLTVSSTAENNSLKKNSTTSTSRNVSFWISWRMAVCVAGFMGATMHSVMRSILGMTLVCMVKVNRTNAVDSLLNNNTNDTNTNQTVTTYNDEICKKPSDFVEDYDGDFDWSVKEQGYIVAAMAWGQLVTALPAGLYADKYSARKLLFCAILIAALLTGLTPFAARLGVICMVLVRLAVGLTGGILWPCMNALIARWSPANERSTLYGIVTGGNQLSIVFLMPISALLCKQKHFLGGWPVNYYITALISVVWCLVWLLVTADDPSEHKYISKEELSHITGGRTITFDKKKRACLRMPYKEVFFSTATLAIVSCLVSAAWGILLLLNYLPTYLRDVLYLDLTSNGDFSGLPFLAQFVLKMVFSRVADYLKKHTSCDHRLIVKGFNTFGMCSLAGFLFGATFLNCNHSALAVALLCMGAGFYSAITPGFLASMVLIAPKYAGLLAAWTNFLGTFSGIILPYVVGTVVSDREPTAAQWRIVIGVGSIAQVISSVIFIFWGSSEEEEWAKSLNMQYDSSLREDKKEEKQPKESLLDAANKSSEFAEKQSDLRKQSESL